MDKRILKKLHSTHVDILQEVVRVCEEHNLDYFLIGGTLLGAIRHKGFIPWDDDLDIAMPRKDYEKFLCIAKSELNDKYWVHCNFTDPDYWWPFVKVKKKKTIFEERANDHIEFDKGIYIDVFPLDNARTETSITQSTQSKLVKNLQILINRKREASKSKPRRRSMLIALKLFQNISISALYKFQQRIMSMNKNEESKYFVNLGSQYNYIKQTIPKDKYYPPTKVKFEGDYYNAPNDWDYVLTRIYGDYMKLPPKDKQVTHNPARIKFEDGEEIIF